MEMSTRETECPMCESEETQTHAHTWAYTKDVEGDTTFETPSTLYVLDRAKKMVLQATEDAMARSLTLCLSRPPGHHSCSDKKRRGFCHRNFVIDALDAFQKKGLRAIIVDIDAHHGDGTEEQLLKRDYGAYVSIHGFGENVYPGTGGDSESDRTLNLPLKKEAKSDEWLAAWTTKVLPFVISYSPDIVLLSCGLDAHEADTLAPLQITTDCYLQVGKDLCALKIPVFGVLEGGYCLTVLGDCVKEIVSAFL